MKQLQRVVAVVVLALALLPAGLARADKKTDAAAKKAYEDGTKFYSLGDFPKAIENYKRAFELKPDAVFLYNIAQSYRLSNDFNQALFFYKSFLRNLPDAPNRVEVERRITEMDEALARQKATANAPPNDPLGPKNNPTNTPEDGDTGTTTDGDGDTDGDTGDTGTTKIPDPTDAGDASDVGQENGTVPAGGPSDGGGSGKKPIYKKWWFWAGIGAVAVGTVAIIAVSSGGGTSSPPAGDFDTIEVF